MVGASVRPLEASRPRQSNPEEDWNLQERTGMTVAMRFIATGNFESNRLLQSARSCRRRQTSRTILPFSSSAKIGALLPKVSSLIQIDREYPQASNDCSS